MIIGRLKDIWRVPYPAYITSWKTVAIPAAIIFLILYLPLAAGEWAVVGIAGGGAHLGGRVVGLCVGIATGVSPLVCRTGMDVGQGGGEYARPTVVDCRVRMALRGVAHGSCFGC